MAREEQIRAIRERKRYLSDQLAVSREAVSLSGDLVKQSLNVKRRLSRKLSQNQTKVAVGSALIGLVGSTLMRRRKKSKEAGPRRGIGGWITGLLIGVITKKAKGVAIDKIRAMLLQRIRNRNQHL